MSAEEQPKFAVRETRVIDGISYTAVVIDYSTATALFKFIDKRTGVHPEANAACSRCFIYAADRTEWHPCRTQCQPPDAMEEQFIVRTDDLPLLALEGLL